MGFFLIVFVFINRAVVPHLCIAVVIWRPALLLIGGGLVQFFVTSRGIVFEAGVRARLRRSLVGSFFNNLECCCSLSSLLQGLLCLMHAYARDHGAASFCFFIVSGIMSLVALFHACDCVGGEPSQAPVVLLVARQLQLVQFGACLCVRQPLPTPPAVSWDIAGRLW